MHCVPLTMKFRSTARCNRTRFAGLENNMADCYANALIDMSLLALSTTEITIVKEQHWQAAAFPRLSQ